ncbi:UPF0481 protein At3g47200-like [Lycium ferocissimum]|uniref:UPF0481 protein At3g47200-like n=1 Tax=Lycium ferocissimum TaxID=112874 RepID=UPI0028151147|nr:UPF0481 protein At3g47200-like [Lycium ferocissimum]
MPEIQLGVPSLPVIELAVPPLRTTLQHILPDDDINSRAAEVADWLHAKIDIPGPPSSDEETHKIQTIPPALVENTSREDYSRDAKYYWPLMVSIGPIHYGKPHVQPMEDFKRKSLRELSESVKNQVTIEQVYASVEQELLRARNCYSCSFQRWEDHEWCLMMFLDGCFIVKFIIDQSPNARKFYMKEHDRDVVRRDLLLFENQLPFQVLTMLAHAFRCEELFSLGLLNKFFIQMPFVRISPPYSTPTIIEYIFRCVKRRQAPRSRYQPEVPAHLLQYCRSLWIGHLFNDDEEEEEGGAEDHLAICPPSSVTELKKVGIRCSPAMGLPIDVPVNLTPGIHTFIYTFVDTLPDIHFKSSMLSGKLFFPRLTIDENTMTLFSNLVAYEYSCSSRYKTSGISSFLSFMGMFINGEEDVKELRARGILQINLKVADEQAVVIKFFRYITAHIEPNPQAFRYAKQQISTYCKSKRLALRVAYAEFKQRYFSGPWSFLVFLAVVFTVSMTVIQTVLTGIQTYKKD